MGKNQHFVVHPVALTLYTQFLPMEKLISVATATQFIAKEVRNFGTETVALTSAQGRILAEQVEADRPFPPFDRVTMDGIAIQYESWQIGQRVFRRTGVQAAGSPPLSLTETDACLEVMTGAVLPTGANAVIPYEWLEEYESHFKIVNDSQIEPFANVHRTGADGQKGDVVLPPFTLLGAPHLAVLGTSGKTLVVVKRLPKILLVTTGNELVEVDQTPLPWQIRKSNHLALEGLLRSAGFSLTFDHVEDDETVLLSKLEQWQKEADVLILTGGVSKGKFDYLPQLLAEAGIEKRFHKVAQRPGKPLWFGVKPGAKPVTVFALPGNPVSCFMCTVRYVLPFLQACLGAKLPSPVYARLSEPISFNKPIALFQPVTLSCSEAGSWQATPIKGNGSGDFLSLTEANGFVELPPNENGFAAGETFRAWPW